MIIQRNGKKQENFQACKIRMMHPKNQMLEPVTQWVALFVPQLRQGEERISSMLAARKRGTLSSTRSRNRSKTGAE